MDDCCSIDDSMGAGTSDRLYDGLFHSHPAGCCHYHGASQRHSGAKVRLEERIFCRIIFFGASEV